MKTRINIGIVGCGGICPVHLGGYKALFEAGVHDVRVTALCDIAQAAIRRYRKRAEGTVSPEEEARRAALSPAFPHIYVDDFQKDVEAKGFTDHREMLRTGQVDAVVILTSHGAHHAVAIDCLAAGKHVLVEKPMAVTVRGCRRMIEAAHASRVVLSVAQCFRFEKSCRALRWLLDSGRLGVPQVLSWCNVGRGKVSPRKDAVHGEWRVKRLSMGAGETLENGVHAFDTARYLLGEARSIAAVVETFERTRREYGPNGQILREISAETDDAFFAVARFASGAVGQFSHVNNAHGEPLNADLKSYSLHASKGSVKATTMVLDDGTREDVTDLFDREGSPEIKSRFFPLGLSNRYALETYDFLEAIRRGRQAEVSGEEGLRNVACGYAMVESSRLGCAVDPLDVESGKLADSQKEVDRHYGL